MMATKPEKILIAMHKLSKGTSDPCRYEDIVVAVFELFPSDFQLRGYPKYPDSSDIHKPLYGPLKKQGLVRTGSKMFSLTDKGLTRAREYVKDSNGAKKGEGERLTRDIQQELERLKATNAARCFFGSEKDKILDTDFYSYIGATVRTEKNDFLGRLRVVNDAVAIAVKIDPQMFHQKLKELNDYMMQRFADIVRKRQGGNQ